MGGILKKQEVFWGMAPKQDSYMYLQVQTNKETNKPLPIHDAAHSPIYL